MASNPELPRSGSEWSGLCRVADPAWLRLGPRGSLAFMLAGCLLLVGWQMQVPDDPAQLDRTYERSVGFGLYRYRIQKFFYFFYYTGKFPISTKMDVGHLRWNEKDAWRALGDDAGVVSRLDQKWKTPKLIMEDRGFLRTGDLGKIFLLYPHAWVNGTPKRATLRAFNRGLGIASLLALFVSFALLNHRLLGTTLVLVLGSHPFQMVELYAKNNIFGHPIAIASLMLALHAPLILTSRPRGRWVYLLPIVSGVFLASFRETRLEPALVILSVAGCYLFVAGGWRRRTLLVGMLAVTAMVTSTLWTRYWDAKFEDAYAIVERQGGVTFDGDWNTHHAFWHSLWWGLGDFASDKGYWPDDRAAHAYGIPRVNQRFGTKYRTNPYSRSLRDYYTAERKHRVKPETLPEYGLVLKEKVLGDIRADPLWYAGIIVKRLDRLFSLATPIRLGIGARYVDVPFSAWLFLPAILWLAYLRRWDQLKLLAFYLPASLSTVAVFSGKSMPYNSAFHLVLFAVVVCWAAQALSAARTLRVRRSIR